MAGCNDAALLSVRRFLDEMDEKRDRADLREVRQVDVLASHVRCCGMWGGSALRVAGSMNQFLTDLDVRQVVPRDPRSSI